MISPWPANPQLGQWFQGAWVWDGGQWVCAQPLKPSHLAINIVKFTASGTYTASPGLVTCVVECLGAGGGGGDAGTLDAVHIVCGGGGGSGGYSRRVLSAAQVADLIVPVSIGDGGPAQTPGGGTSFGGFVAANGGLPGIGNNGVDGFGQGGAGAPPGSGDWATAGAWGTDGVTIPVSPPYDAIGAGGLGGQIFGGARFTSAGVGAMVAGGSAWPNSGAGGSGAAVNQILANVPGLIQIGGAGGSGLVLVTEYVATPD